MTPTTERPANEHGDRHPEAFCLMLYGCDDKSKGCGAREELWNTRDGVTPFAIGCRACSEWMSHLPPWQDDVRAPYHSPVYGDRIIVDRTPKRREVLARRTFEKMWASPIRPTLFKGMDKAAALELHVETMCGADDGYGLATTDGTPIDTRKGEPDILTIGRDVVWLGGIPKGASVENIHEMLAPQLCLATMHQDLEKLATHLEADEAMAGFGFRIVGSSTAELDDLERPSPVEVKSKQMTDRLEAMRKAAVKSTVPSLEELRAKLDAGGIDELWDALPEEDKRRHMRELREAAGFRVSAAPLLKRALGHEGPTYVLTRYDADGKVSDIHEAADTENGRASLATVMLMSLSSEKARATVVEEADRIKRGELPPELLESMRTMKRGKLPSKFPPGHCDPALYEDRPAGKTLEVELSDEVGVTDELRPVELEGVGDHGRFYEAGGAELLDSLADGIEAEVETGGAVRVEGDKVSGVLKVIHEFGRKGTGSPARPFVRGKKLTDAAAEAIEAAIDGALGDAELVDSIAPGVFAAAKAHWPEAAKDDVDPEGAHLRGFEAGVAFALEAALERTYQHKPPAIVTIPIRMPRDATPEELKAQEGPGGCTHAVARVDANLIHLEDSALRVLDVTVRCEECRHRFRFKGLPVAIDPTRPCTNLIGTIATFPVELGPLDTIKTCERCNKDHDDSSGLLCATCATELAAENALRMRVTCRACGHSASFRESEKEPKKCRRCRSKKIDIEQDEFIMDCAQYELTVELLDESMREAKAESYEEIPRPGTENGQTNLLDADGKRVGRVINYSAWEPALLKLRPLCPGGCGQAESLCACDQATLPCPHVGDQEGEAECDEARPCFSRSARKIREGDELGHVEAAAAHVAPSVEECMREKIAAWSDAELAAKLGPAPDVARELIEEEIDRRAGLVSDELDDAFKAAAEGGSTEDLSDFPEDLDASGLSDAVKRVEQEKGGMA